MALSTGGRSLLTDLAGWAFAAGMCAVGVIYSAEIKAVGYQMMGVAPPDVQMTATTRRDETSATPRSTSSSSRAIELRAGGNGHFMAEAEINGRRVDVMVDTGASIIALTYEDAETIGVAPSARDFTHQVNTANGIARIAPVRLERVMIGDIMVRDVQAAVAERGKLHVTLLGNSFLSRVSYRMANGRLIIEE
jgi:aspartyl protease family protein